MRPLVTDMVNADPTKCPTIDEVVARFEEIKNGLSSWKLRCRVRGKNEHYIFHIYRIAGHWYRRIGYILKRVRPVPTPTS
ncbi:hypothetical protein B0H10DRAFT_638547 [Mycena sp. CBHHK59/15]|nr:hypothetical protein B0H10DRAFT_638547 [Mycena sp. CBHHK59/15]